MSKIDHWQPSWRARLPLLSSLERQRYRSAFARPESSGWFSGVYPDRESAERDAPPTQPVGYDNPASARLYSDRLDQVYVSDYPMMFWLEKLLAKGARKVLDIGGHVGVAYFAYQKYFRFPDDIDWTVQEVPAVVEAGRKRAALKGVAHQLRFAETLPTSERYDVVFSSGALQYVEPSLGQLIGLFQHKPVHILVNHLPVHATSTFFTLQNIGTAFCVYRVSSASAALAGLGPIGYGLVDHWVNAEKSCVIPFAEAMSLDHYRGFLLSQDAELSPGASRDVELSLPSQKTAIDGGRRGA